MKKLSLFSSLCLGALTVSAVSLTPEEALNRAVRHSQKKVQATESKPYVLADTRNIDGNACLYIFRTAGGDGYLVAPADDNTAPVLGFSAEGSLPDNPDDYSDGLKFWLDHLAADVESNSAAAAPAAAAPMKSRKNISPLISTQWNQKSPFNDLCPTVSGTVCPTGCVATAVAQLMKYHRHFKYPQTNSSTVKSYTWAAQNTTLSYDFGNVSFDWDKMLNSYSSGGTSAQRQEVAKLMYACAMAVESNFKPGGTSSNVVKLLNGMLNTLGYSRGMRLYSRTRYTDDEWEAILHDNLSRGLPVYYEGSDSKGGHAFICDGYSDGYWHFNWGWGGRDDGYFLLSALNPSASGTSDPFNQYVDIVADIMPDAPDIAPCLAMEWKGDFNIGATSVAAGATLAATGGFFNVSAATVTDYEAGLIFEPASGGEIVFIKDAQVSGHELPFNHGFFDYTFYIDIPYDMPTGSYKVYPGMKGSDGVAKRMPMETDRVQFRNVTVTERVFPESLYLMGNLKAGAWATNVGVAMTRDGHKYKAEDVEMVAGEAYFSFVTALGATGSADEWNDIINKSDRYGAVAPGIVVELGVPVAVMRYAAGSNAGNSQSWCVMGNGRYDFTVDFDTMTLEVMQHVKMNGDGYDGPRFEIFFDNSRTNWATPTVYYWGSYSPDYPGITMTPYTDGIWRAELPMGTSGLLFNAGDGDATKTADFNAIEGHVYTVDGDQGLLDAGNDDTPTMPERLFIVGNINNESWNIASPVELDRQDKIMVTKVDFTPANGVSGKSYFSFITSTGTDWNNHINCNDRYGAEYDGQEVTPDAELPIKRFTPTGAGHGYSSACYAWSVSPGTYYVTTNFGNNMLTLSTDITTAVGSLTVTPDVPDSSDAVYYDFSGRRVANPSAGIYIKVAGSRVTKVYVE